MNRNSYQKENQPERITILGKLLRWLISSVFCSLIAITVVNAGQFPRNYPGLVGLFHFNDNGLGYYINSNADPGAYAVDTTAPILSNGKFSFGYLFTDYSPTSTKNHDIYLSAAPSSICGSNPRTFIFWLNLKAYAPAADERAIFGYGQNANSANPVMFYVFVGSSTNNQCLSVQTYETNAPFATDSSADNVIPLNQWTQYAITYDGNKKIKFYKNGTLKWEHILSGTLNTTQSEFMIGEKHVAANVQHAQGLNQYAMSGILDELVILNYAVSGNEIKKIYQEQVGNYSQCEQ